MKAAVFALAVFSFALVASTASALTGTELRNICQVAARNSTDTSLELAVGMQCQGFVEAIVTVGRRLREPNRFCAPDGVTVGQAINVLVKYLNENPAQLHHGGELLAITAFNEAWPCK